MTVKMREGVPQGDVVSPTPFLIYINNITTVIPRHVSNTLHADDPAIWSSAEYTTSAAHRMQDAANKVHKWTRDWGLQIKQVKTQSTVFSLSTTKEQVKIKLGDRILPQAETPIFLGAKLDSRLSSKPQTESENEKKGHPETSPTEVTLWHTLGGITLHSKDSVHCDSSTNA